MGSKLKYIFILLLFVRPGSSFSQSINPQYNFKHLNVQSGLAQNIVYRFLQDSYGYVWVGTHNGLTRFDGASAISFMHDNQKTHHLSWTTLRRTAGFTFYP